MDCDVLTLPGLWNSGPQHWQTHWERQHPNVRRLAHRDWDTPQREEWVSELDAAIAACKSAPVLAAHSLSCALVAHWAGAYPAHRIAGAFLVAPSDVEADSYPREPVGFEPMPLVRLPFPSIVVASTNDEYVTVERARAFAAAWGSRFVEIGEAGHINGDAGYGPWPEGEQMLKDFCAQLARR
jgi:predicted alpha/beta hydrolase family esterase